MTDENKKQIALLDKNVKAAIQKFITSRGDERDAALIELDRAQSEIEELELALITPEHKEAIKSYDLAKAAMNKADLDLADATLKLSAFNPAILKKPRVNSGGGDHAPKFTYEDAQEIRKWKADGKTIREISEHFNISSSGVQDKVNYTQFKLRKGDVEYTPLINSKYPTIWRCKDGRLFSGAPFVEDKVTETDQKYKGYTPIEWDELTAEEKKQMRVMYPDIALIN